MNSIVQSTDARRRRLAGPLALAAAAATILLAGMALAILARAELQVREAVEHQRALDAAVREASAAATALASQNAAWKAYLLATHLRDDRRAIRAQSALATATAEVSERIDRLVPIGASAELPTEGATRAVASAALAKDLLVEALADLRQSDEGALVAADQTMLPALEQARFELLSLFEAWNAHASDRRVLATTQAADRARRIKAWIEILSLIAVSLVIALGAIAVRKETVHARQ